MRAGSLNHNVPCRGYCYEEFSNESTSSQHRKISIFGDTYDSELILLVYSVFFPFYFLFFEDENLKTQANLI